MTKSQLIDRVSESGGHSRRTIEAATNAVFESMLEALQCGDRVEVRGFGNFTVREYRSYVGRNPRTGDVVPVPMKRMPFFRVGKDLRGRLNGE